MRFAGTGAWVAFGGALGASLRWGCASAVSWVGGESWWATLGVNLVASACMGWVFLLLEARYRETGPTRVRVTSHYDPLRRARWFREDDATELLMPEVRSNDRLQARTAFWVTGLLGGFSTFSTFSLEVVQLLQRGSIAAAAANLVVSVVACLAGVVGGMFLGRLWLLRWASRLDARFESGR